MWLGPSAKSALTFTGVVQGNLLLGWSSRGTGTSGLPEAPPLIFLIEAHWHKAARSPLPTLAPQPGLLYFQNSNSPLKEETHVREKIGHIEPRASFWLNLPESASTLTWKITLELNPKVFLSLTLSDQKKKYNSLKLIMHVDLNRLVVKQTAWALNTPKNDVRVYPLSVNLYKKREFYNWGSGQGAVISDFMRLK